ncbi:hypothetical protein LTR53_013335, partial [Teratosphaeriaceae sp. CCFEE 6253]
PAGDPLSKPQAPPRQTSPPAQANGVSAKANVVSPLKPQKDILAFAPSTPSALELDNTTDPTAPPIVTARPDSPSSQPPPLPASDTTAPSPQPPATTAEVRPDPSDPSDDRPRKRRRRSSSPHPHSQGGTAGIRTGPAPKQRRPKRQRGDDPSTIAEPSEPSMRLNSTQEPHRAARPSTNGSSANGSSPHNANGSVKSSGTNGYHTNGHHTEEGGAGAVKPHDSSPFYGHDREEVTRILLQSLSDLGYAGAARQLSQESGYELEIASVAALRVAVQRGEWGEAEALLLGSEGWEADGGVLLGNGHGHVARRKSRTSFGSQNGYARQGLPLVDGADTTMLRFLLRQQKYLELLEARELNTALHVLRNELTPLKRDIARLHALSSLMMCQSAADLRHQAAWDGATGTSRGALLSELSLSISPSIMIPEHRLATLLTAVQEEQILACRYHSTTQPPTLYTDHACAAADFPLHTLRELRNHADEVWHLEFSHDGSMLATAGKDGLVCVYDTRNNYALRHELREHDRHPGAGGGDGSNKGVSYVAFSPDDTHLISCAQNNEFVVVRLRDGRRVAHADFDYPVTTAAWLPDSIHFVVGTQGSRKPLGLYSLRSADTPSTATTTTSSNSTNSAVVRNNEIHSWRDPPWDATAKDHGPSFRITDCAVDAAGTRLAATTIENRILLYDLHSYAKVAEWPMEEKLTSIAFSPDSAQLLVNMNHGRVMLLSAVTGEVEMQFEGAEQKDFVLRSCFGGPGGGTYVLSGSEDARVLIWRRATGQRVASLEACGAGGTVNAVAWCHGGGEGGGVWASAGDDRRVRM